MANFTYFDQFQDMQIDLTAYLDKLSKSASAPYKYNLSNKQPVITNIKNLFTKYDIIIDYKKNVEVILSYDIKENETIEQVSYKVYDTIDYWWIVAVFNDITNPFNDWPLNQEQLNNAADILYNNEGKYPRNVYYNFLFEQNESKRRIILPRDYVIGDIIWAYREKVLAS